jgi:hypothetical protein
MNTNQALSVEPAPENLNLSSVVCNAGFGSVFLSIAHRGLVDGSDVARLRAIQENNSGEQSDFAERLIALWHRCALWSVPLHADERRELRLAALPNVKVSRCGGNEAAPANKSHEQ